MRTRVPDRMVDADDVDYSSRIVAAAERAGVRGRAHIGSFRRGFAAAAAGERRELGFKRTRQNAAFATAWFAGYDTFVSPESVMILGDSSRVAKERIGRYAQLTRELRAKSVARPTIVRAADLLKAAAVRERRLLDFIATLKADELPDGMRWRTYALGQMEAILNDRPGPMMT